MGPLTVSLPAWRWTSFVTWGVALLHHHSLGVGLPVTWCRLAVGLL